MLRCSIASAPVPAEPMFVELRLGGGLGIGLGQTLLALVPLATLLLAVAQGQERLGLGAVIGTLLALAGVA
jgi:drug/metabolite transporter (DMT)-like permease